MTDHNLPSGLIECDLQGVLAYIFGHWMTCHRPCGSPEIHSTRSITDNVDP